MEVKQKIAAWAWKWHVMLGLRNSGKAVALLKRTPARTDAVVERISRSLGHFQVCLSSVPDRTRPRISAHAETLMSFHEALLRPRGKRPKNFESLFARYEHTTALVKRCMSA